MSDNLFLADINLPLLKWLTNLKLNRDLFSTARNQNLKSITEIYRDLQYNIIPPKDEELQNLWTSLYDLNNYFINSIDYNQIEKSLLSLKSKYRNVYLKGFYEICNWFNSLANEFDPNNFNSNEGVSNSNSSNNNPANKINDIINNLNSSRKLENKENSLKLLVSFEAYVPTVEEIKRIYCIENKEILIDKSNSLPADFKLFHSFSLLNLYVFLIIVVRIYKLINEIYKTSSPEIIQLTKEYSNQIKTLEEFLQFLKINNLFYVPNKKEVLLRYSTNIYNNDNNQTNNSSNNGNSNQNLNNLINNGNVSTSSLGSLGGLVNDQVKIFEFTEKELKYSKRYFNYNEFSIRPAELPSSLNNNEINNLIFYTTTSNNTFKMIHHKPIDIKPKIILSIYNNILSMSKIDNNINNNSGINSNGSNSSNNINSSFSSFNSSFSNLNLKDSINNEAGLDFGVNCEVNSNNKECFICRFRSDFLMVCSHCNNKLVCHLCSVNKTCWDCYFKEEQHYIPLEVVVKLEDRKFPRLIYLLLKSYSFRDLMNSLYQDKFERDTVISLKDRLTYKLHKTKLYNFHLVIPNNKNNGQFKEIKIFDDYSLIVSLRLLMNYILSNYIIDQSNTTSSNDLNDHIKNNNQNLLNNLINNSAQNLSYNSDINNNNNNNSSSSFVANDSDSNIDDDISSIGNSNTNNSMNSNTGGSNFNIKNNPFRKNSTGSGTGTRGSNNSNNSNNSRGDSNNHNNNNNHSHNNDNSTFKNKNIIVTIENPLIWSIEKFVLNVSEANIEIDSSLKIPFQFIKTEDTPFASGGQANIYMVKHIEWPVLSNFPSDSFVFKHFVENKDALQIEEDKERELYEEKIYYAYKTSEGIDNFKYNFSNIEQTDKKSLATLFYEEVDKLKKLQFSEYIIKMPAISDDDPNRRGMLLECAMGSLKTHLLEFRSWKLIIRFMMDICLGMMDIHRCQIIHRDLKPDNILVFETSSKNREEFGGLICKITDLGAGINNVLVHDNNFTSTFHTDDYVPEEYGKYHYDGVLVDIYSFGCTFFEMITKHRYQHKHPTPLHKDFLTTDFQYIPIRIKNLIASLVTDASQRKQSFEEVYYDLEDIYKNVIPGLPDIPLSIKVQSPHPLCKRCNPPK
ncbi:hypothetical protein DICPUDRAFT_36123 [Dictyostelium purpureum]|uniref:Protein kinase domain-containing protein n=1 Tax=Dictyostelium purpureum TaxID=5786 RepID=F0ZQF7_DICPU|nr:uncharacterized protein DICPUDRAFT_36123 [Dictyostelium purpureum]EGC33820.1 hypothetical protein DICPUDRAFT_36123 [Dictyostelium purpureum]|eukprot:XP_003289646.1 hypothetical protein DICPUDRAFT_36123 [Dictyostelium purpureum]